MPTTQFKGLEVQVTGTNENTWGDILNNDTIEVIDRNLGGIVVKTLSNVQVDLDADESQNLIVRLIGTLTGNVLVTTLCEGMTMVENATSGAFAVTFQLNGVGSAVTIPQGTRAVVITDATNGARIAADNQTEFSSGFKMFTSSPAAPTGWTISPANANRGIRVHGTVGGGTGGSADFTDIFTTRALTGTVTGTAITIAQMPLHGHPAAYGTAANNDCDGRGGLGLATDSIQTFPSWLGALSTSGTTPPGRQIGPEGGGQSHDHGLQINNMNFNLKYLDVIEIQKN